MLNQPHDESRSYLHELGKVLLEHVRELCPRRIVLDFVLPSFPGIQYSGGHVSKLRWDLEAKYLEERESESPSRFMASNSRPR